MKCETVGCDGVAEFLDEMDNRICSDCMEMAVDDGDDLESFERIKEAE